MRAKKQKDTSRTVGFLIGAGLQLALGAWFIARALFSGAGKGSGVIGGFLVLLALKAYVTYQREKDAERRRVRGLEETFR